MSRKEIAKLYGEPIASKGYKAIPSLVLNNPRALHKNLKPQHLAVLIYLLSLFKNEDKYPYPSHNTMMQSLNLSKPTLKKYLKDLQSMGLIKIQQQRLKQGEYKTLDTKEQKAGMGEQSSNVYNLTPLIQRLNNILISK